MILTLNAGSSSLKFALYAADAELQLLCRGQVEGFGAVPRAFVKDGEQSTLLQQSWSQSTGPDDVPKALVFLFGWFKNAYPAMTIQAVGHRIVHGGPEFTAPTVLSAEVQQSLTRYSALAPLHQPPNLLGVTAARTTFPQALQVACFDTAFHHTQQWTSQVYALPRTYYEQGIRRYGFHGLSYEYLQSRLHALVPSLANGRIIMAHLGNGASLCALKDSRSVATTMGFSVLDGLPMGTRCGQIDPGVLLHLLQTTDMTPARLTDLLYHDAGLKGLSGISHDMRVLEASPAPAAAQAIDYFIHRLRYEIGGLAALLGGLDVLVFSGGIGENSDRIRARVVRDLAWLGLDLDAAANARHAARISTAKSRCACYMIKTDEEQMIAQHTLAVLAQRRAGTAT